MTATTCKLCFAPISTCACVTDEHLAARFAAMRQPPLREFLGARERIRVRQFPDVVAGEQTEWSALATHTEAQDLAPYQKGGVAICALTGSLSALSTLSLPTSTTPWTGRPRM